MNTNGIGAPDFQRSKTHCPQGHEYTRENTKLTKDGRACRACHRACEERRRRTVEGKGRAAARMRTWRRRNRPEYLQAKLQRKQRAKEWLATFRFACCRCGEDHPGVLDFHHRNPEEKDFPIGYYVNSLRSRTRVLAEIAKCDVLCANCHRKHHWEERQSLNKHLEGEHNE